MSTVYYQGVAITIERGRYYIGCTSCKTLGEAKATISRIRKKLKKSPQNFGVIKTNH